MESHLKSKKKILSISKRLLLDLFTEGIHKPYKVVSDAIPEDADITFVQMTDFGYSIDFVIQSDEFEETEDGKKYPYILPTMEQINE